MRIAHKPFAFGYELSPSVPSADGKYMTKLSNITLALTLIFILMVVVSIVATNTIVLKSFVNLEDDNARININRAIKALDEDISFLDTLNYDWATWDDTYEFIAEKNIDYIKSNLVDSSFTDLRLNHIIYIEPSGKVIYSKGFDLEKEQEAPLLESFMEHIKSGNLLLEHKNPESSVKGIVLLPDGLMMVSSRPIVTSEGEGPIRGALIMARLFNAEELDRISNRTELSLSLISLDDPVILEALLSAGEGKDTNPVFQKSANSITAYALLRDIYGKPAISIKSAMPRNIYMQGKRSISYFIFTLFGISLIFGTILWKVLNKYISSEEALSIKEQNYRAVVEDQTELVNRFTPDGTLTFVNNATCSYYGLKGEYLIGRSFLPMVPEKERDRLVNYFASFRKEKPEGSIICYVFMPDTGEKRWQSWTNRAIFDKKGNIVEYQGVGRDITERKKTEEALRLSKETLALAQSVANIGSWSWDFITNELEWSDATYDLFKFDKNEKPLLDDFVNTLHPDDKDRVSNAINLSRTEKAPFDIQCRIIRTDNVQRHVQAKGNVLFNDKDEAYRMLGMIYDITEQVEAQESIAKSLMEKEVLLREIHHRVKNNMAVISSLLSLQSGYVEDNKYLDMFVESQNRIKSMALVHEKLYQSDDFAHIDVQGYVKSLAENIRSSFFTGDRDVKLNVNVDELNLDIDNLVPCGLLMNEILTNSFKHAFNGHDSPEITITMTKLEDGNISLSISDNGMGLPDGYDISKPTGLGHKLIKPLIHQIDGTMEVTVDNGTEFRFIFPEKLALSKAD